MTLITFSSLVVVVTVARRAIAMIGHYRAVRQAQRTAAARMFVRGAKLLVIDDLSSALDVETERVLWACLFASGDVTYLTVSPRRAAPTTLSC